MTSHVTRAIARPTFLALLGSMLLLAGCGGGGSESGTGDTAPNNAPVISSSDSVNVAENTTSVLTVSASDADGDTLTYSLSGSVDDSLFTIDGATGALSFISAPDFEAPADSGADNTYNIEVTVTDGRQGTKQSIAISVSDVLELNATSGGVRTLSFSWSTFDGATYYKLMVNPNGSSGFVQEGTDITGTSVDVLIPVHLTDWFNASYLLEAYDGAGNRLSSSSATTVADLMLASIGYFKASNTGAGDRFGGSVALSGDGHTLTVGVTHEDSSTTGVNSTPDDGAPNSGAVYLFRYDTNTGTWAEEAYIKASNTGAVNRFGVSVALSDNGNTLAVGADWEDSSTTGINSTPDENASASGAVYLFRYDTNTGTWAQEAYLKASNTGTDDRFGGSVALSGDGNTLAVGAIREDSSTNGVNSTPDENASASGAAYVFRYDTTTGNWAEEAYVKTSNPRVGDYFGGSVALSQDGNTLAVAAVGDDSSTTGVNSTPDTNATDSGAAYLFRYDTTTGNWAQEAYFKASNTGAGDEFGKVVALSNEGNILAVGAHHESSSTTGVNSTPDENASASGAAYVFRHDITTGDWAEEAYVKASNTGADDRFGIAISLSGDGNALAVGASLEDSGTAGVNSAPDDNAQNSGAAYLFLYDSTAGNWAQEASLKASNPEASDLFGVSVTLSDDGRTLAVGALSEGSSATGVNGTPDENMWSSGAVYLY